MDKLDNLILYDLLAEYINTTEDNKQFISIEDLNRLVKKEASKAYILDLLKENNISNYSIDELRDFLNRYDQDLSNLSKKEARKSLTI